MSRERMRILMLGLDGAGKTSILYRLIFGEAFRTTATVGFNVKTISHGDVDLCVWDIGGNDDVRPLWKQYYPNTQGVIFVIDSNDERRVGLAKTELFKMIREDDLSDALFLIIANKQDLPQSLKVQEIIEILELRKLHHRWHVQGASATSGAGLHEGLTWLSNNFEKSPIFAGESLLPRGYGDFKIRSPTSRNISGRYSKKRKLPQKTSKSKRQFFPRRFPAPEYPPPIILEAPSVDKSLRLICHLRTETKKENDEPPPLEPDPDLPSSLGDSHLLPCSPRSYQRLSSNPCHLGGRPGKPWSVHFSTTFSKEKAFVRSGSSGHGASRVLHNYQTMSTNSDHSQLKPP